jgi:hypothetical protein
MLTCSTRESTIGQGINETLFTLFGINKPLDQDLPIGAVSMVGRGVKPGSSCWAQATPVHLKADKDSVILLRPGQLDISEKDSVLYVELFNEHFKEDGLHLLMHAKNEWYLEVEDFPDLSTTDIESVVGRSIFDYLPSGHDGKKWRGFLNEVQMLFHQVGISSVGTVSEDHRINAIWFSGVGAIPVARASYSAIYTNHPLLTGLAMLSEISHYNIPQLQDEAILPDGDVLVLFETLMDRVLDVDIQGWINDLCTIDSLIGQIVNINKKSILKDIVIYDCEGSKLEVRGGCYRRKIWPLNKKLGRFQGIFRKLFRQLSAKHGIH